MSFSRWLKLIAARMVKTVPSVSGLWSSVPLVIPDRPDGR